MSELLTSPSLPLLMLALFLVGVCPLGVIDINSEHIVTFRELARRLPRRRRGRPACVATVYRWRNPGVRGVRLEAVRLPSGWVTSEEAYERFVARVTRQAEPSERAGGTAGPVHERIERELDDHGI